MLIGKEKFYKKLINFGIASKTGIELPAESQGVLKNYKNWSDLDLATTSFGQGSVAVTPVQFLGAINSVINNGLWVQPHIIRGLKTYDGKKYIKKTRPIKKRVISSKTAKLVTGFLGEAVRLNLEDKSHISGNIQNFSVAGKTGTAQKYNPETGKYYPDKKIMSFFGCFPAEKAKISILVVFDSPKTGGSGDSVAGKVFNEVANEMQKIYPESYFVEKI